jgi:hypothetical protein
MPWRSRAPASRRPAALPSRASQGSMREKGYEMECGRIKNDVTIKVSDTGRS